MSYRKILVPVDGSATSREGLREAIAVARAQGAVSGRVTDPLGGPVSNATVSLSGPGLSSPQTTQSGSDGSFSLGFTTTVLPAAMAIGKNHIGTIAGKLNGEMIPTTPRG